MSETVSGTIVSGNSEDLDIVSPGRVNLTQAAGAILTNVTVDAPGAILVLDSPVEVSGAFVVDAGTVVFNGGLLSVGTFDLEGGTLIGSAIDITASSSIELNGGSIVANTATLIDSAGTVTLPALGTVQTASVSTPIATGWTKAVSFAQFNPMLGTLVSINAALTATVAGSVSVQSLEGAPSSVTVSLTGSASAVSPSLATLATEPFDLVSTSASLGAAGSSAVVLTPSGTVAGSGTVYPGTADVAAFTGSGSVPVTLSAAASVVVTGPANMRIGSGASAAATASLQYGYAPVGLGAYYSDDYGSGSTTTIFTGPVGLFPSGDTTAPQTFTFADQTTGWHNTLAAAGFNPMLGTLEAVNITVTGDIQASVAAENEDSTAGSVTATQVATVALALPGGAVTAAPTVTAALALGAFDGAVDYAGTSGKIDQGLTATNTTTVALTDTADLAAFLGQGTVTVPISDLGTGTLTGPANLAAALLAQSGATVTIDYSYAPPVTDTWTHAGSGNWTTAADWSAAPLATDAIAITQAGTYTITQTAAEAAESVLIDAPGATLVLDAPLTVMGGFTLEAGTVVFDAGALTAGSVDLTGGLVTGNTVDISASGGITVTNALIDAGPLGAIRLTSGSVSVGVDQIATIGVIASVGTIGTQTTSGLIIGNELMSVPLPATDTWINTAGGAWSVGSNWSSSPNPPGPSDSVFLNAPGSYTVTISTSETIGSLTLADHGATLLLNGTLAVDDVLNIDAGAVQIFSGGLSGGTVVVDGGGVVFSTINASDLSDLLWRGAFDAADANIGLSGSFDIETLSGAPGTMTLDSVGLQFSPAIAATLDATLDFSGGSDLIGPYFAALTLGPQVVVSVGAGASLTLQPGGGGTIVNQGTFDVSGAGASVTTNGLFTNAGVIVLSRGGELIIGYNVGTLLNTGTIVLGDTASGLTYQSTIATSQLPAVTGAAGELTVGLLDNRGATIAIGSGDAFSTLKGSVLGGTIVNQGGTFLLNELDGVTWLGALDLPDAPFSTLRIADGLSVLAAGGGAGTINLDGATLQFVNTATIDRVRLNLDGQILAGTLTLGSQALLDVVAPAIIFAETLINLGTIDVTSASPPVIVLGTSLGPGVLTDFTNRGLISVTGSGATFDIQALDFTNAGTLLIASGSTLVIGNGLETSTSFVNTGSIAIQGSGSSLVLDGTETVAQLAGISVTGGQIVLAGELDNTGNTLTLAAGGTFGNLSFDDATVLGGTIIAQGGSDTLAGLALTDVVWQGTLDLSAPNQVVDFNGTTFGLRASGPGTEAVYLTGAGSRLGFDAPGTLDNTVVRLGAVGGSVFFSGPTSSGLLISPDGTAQALLTLGSATTLAAVTPGAGLIGIGGNIVNQGLINDADGNVSLGSFTPPPDTINGSVGDYGASVTIGGYPPPQNTTFDNQGTILADAGTGSTFTVGDLTAFSNEGLIQVGNNDRLVMQAGTFTNSGTIALAAGDAEFVAALANLGIIAFTPGTPETLFLDHPATLTTASIQNFSSADAIEFGNHVTLTAASFTAPGTITAITTAGGTFVIAGVSLAAGAGTLLAVGTDPATGDAAIQIASGNTLTWTGSAGSGLAATGNWQGGPNPPPDRSDLLAFTTGGGNLTGTTTAGSLLFQGGTGWDLTGSLGAFGLATLGRDTGSAGALMVGASGSLQSAGITVGGAGLGSLAIQSGGTVVTAGGNAVIADTGSAGGSAVNVTGTGSGWQVGGMLQVGNAGFGELTIAQGATVTATGLDAGVTGTGVIDLSGSGSELSVSGNATIADAGSATLSILNGATVNGSNLTVGAQGTSSGVLTVSDTGSLLNLSGTLYIGTAAGVGDLTVGPGATIIATSVQQQGQVVLEGGLLDPNVINVGAGQSNGGYGAAGDPTGLIDNNGTLLAKGTTKPSQMVQTFLGTIVGQGVMQIDTGSTLELTGPVLTGAPLVDINNDGTPVAVQSAQAVSFEATTGALQLNDIGGFAGTIAAYLPGDLIVITGGVLSGLGVSNGTTLTVADGSGTDRIAFAAGISAGQFQIVNGDTIQVVQCFAAGTRLQTDRGPVAVEALRLGDRLITAEDGRHEPVQWIGRRSVNSAAHPRAEQVWPVRVRRGAFGVRQPARDLFLSPDHAVFVNDVLVPVKYLVNGTSIAQIPRDTVTYYHVELPRHELVLAEGLAVESFLDTGDRSNFENGGRVMTLFPNFTALQWETEGCAPLVIHGPELQAVRAVVSDRQRWQRRRKSKQAA